ncbi:hypothetical protein [Rhodanobacter caeni]|uniref:Uncharacterized protein n=1 Tax=Rhodanobacter caeni TaxID=657654 RepID=A0ABP3EDW1_9GAMM
MSEKSGGEIILYQRGDEPAIDVRLGGELAEQPSEVEAAYLETMKAVQKRIVEKRKP